VQWAPQQGNDTESSSIIQMFAGDVQQQALYNQDRIWETVYSRLTMVASNKRTVHGLIVVFQL